MTWKASRILKMWLDVHGKLIKLVYQKKVYEEAKLTTCTKDDCKGAQVYGRQSRHICETLFGKSTLLQEKKKKGNNQNLFFTFKGKQDLFHNILSLFLPPRFTLKLLEGEGKTETYDWLSRMAAHKEQFWCLNVWSHFTSHASTIFTAESNSHWSISQWDYWKKLYQKND